jgi:AraC-like DNA-binding protein
VDTPADWFYRNRSRAQLPGPICISGAAGSGRVLNHAFQKLVGNAMARPGWTRIGCSSRPDLLRTMLAGEAAGSSALRASHLLAARAHIDEHLHHTHWMSEVAAASGVSPRHLNRMLQTEGHSVTELILIRRLERAAIELRQAALGRYSIAEIAYRCGFASQAHFARRFRSHHGMTPTQCASSPVCTGLRRSGRRCGHHQDQERRRAPDPASRPLPATAAAPAP